jgi:hypothetical protein
MCGVLDLYQTNNKKNKIYKNTIYFIHSLFHVSDKNANIPKYPRYKKRFLFPEYQKYIFQKVTKTGIVKQDY